MLVPFALDSDALFMNSDDLVQQRVIHKRFLQVWNEVGVFFHLEPFVDNSALATKIKMLPQDVKKLWMVAIHKNRRREVVNELKDLSSVTKLADLEKLSDELKLFCFDDVRAYCIGLPYDKESAVVGSKKIEICRFDFIDQSINVEYARMSFSKNIPKGKKIEYVWNNWFKTFATYCTNIVIVDRYTAVDSIERRDNKSGLFRFMAEVDKLANPHNIKIYAARNTKYSDDQLINKIQSMISIFNGSGIGNVYLNLSDDKYFGEIAHYRYVRFDDQLCELDTGLEVLGGDEVYRTCTFNSKSSDQLILKEELALRGNSTCTCLK